MQRDTVAALVPSHFYHVYNRGNNREDLFRAKRNYPHFLNLYSEHILPVADTYAFCLMRNHFHLLIRIKDEGALETRFKGFSVASTARQSRILSQQFSNLFNAYAKAINAAYQRTGALFERPFNRIEVTSDDYFTNLIFYIHFNPQKHSFVSDFRDWPWSSYGALLSNSTTKLKRDETLAWYGGAEHFQAFHRGVVDEKAISALIADDFD